MKIDLNHSEPSCSAFLNLLKSPESESSIVKNVPIPLLESVKRLVREAFPGKKIYVKYRGPRQSVGSCSGTCRKPFAKSAAIYFHY